MVKLWNKECERDFFSKSLQLAKPQQLFYETKEHRFLAYWPKGYKDIKTTLQSRNALIGSYTEKWCVDLFADIGEDVKGYVVPGVICEEIGLVRKKSADVAICKSKEIIQKPENILLIIEVKMSVVWNWQFVPKNSSHFDLICLGDYKTHQGNPGLLRSDTMLKAIGKSINIRVSSLVSSEIPIVIIGNTPVTKSYYATVDQLKRCGIVQGFWSINPSPLDRGTNDDNIKQTQLKGFYRFDDYEELRQSSLKVLKEDREFFASMQSKTRLGEIIEIANKESNYEKKAEKFLELIRGSNE